MSANASEFYKTEPLTENTILKDPLRLFTRWYEKVLKSNIPEANAMALATAGKDGRPAARIVLLKDFDENGFVFYTNYASRKGMHLAENPYAALLFWWPVFARQIRIEGYVSKVPLHQSDRYFKSRPRGHQIGALASRQSQPLTDYVHLEKKYNDLQNDFEDKDIPRPENWGGYLLKAELFEFWQSRANRLHDRFRYSSQKSGIWLIERLAP